MGSLAHLAVLPADPGALPGVRPGDRSTSLERAHRILRAGAHERAHRLLDETADRARVVLDGAGASGAAADLATSVFVAGVVTELAARGDLDVADLDIAVSTLAEVLHVPVAVAAFDLYRRVVTSPTLLELPPVTAAEIQLTLLLHLDVVEALAVWQSDAGELRPLLLLGADLPPGRSRAAARAALRGRAPLFAIGSGDLRAVAVRRFTSTVGALVARTRPWDTTRARAYLEEAARALGPVLERELLLDRSTEREQVLTRSLEKRLMRIGFDLHDGPVQDVLALGSELELLGREIYPFVLDDRRELAAGRFDDLVARASEIDGALREIAHALESRSVTSRPLGETLHRAVDEFSARSGIAGTLEISGDPESLTAAQRIAVFRAIQESLTNVREHSGATSVEVALRARRHSIDVQVSDDGHGFDVERALARAAQHGRLGLVGMGERVRMLGGTFSIDSRPGGPTIVRFALPRTVPT